MISFLNVGPPRSGSTSFYNMMANHPQVNVGSLKEPLHMGYKLSDVKKYLSHWDYTNIERTRPTVILDASPRLVYLKESLNIRKHLGRHIDNFYQVCLIRDLKKYYHTRIFINYLINGVMELRHGFIANNDIVDWNTDYTKIDLDKVERIIDDNILKSKWWNLPELSPLSYLMKVNNVFDIHSVFILPIEFFKEYNKRLQSFLNIDFVDLEYPYLNRSLDILGMIKGQDVSERKVRVMQLYSMIKEKVEKSEMLQSMIIDHLKKIDMIYGTTLYSHYYG